MGRSPLRFRSRSQDYDGPPGGAAYGLAALSRLKPSAAARSCACWLAASVGTHLLVRRCCSAASDGEDVIGPAEIQDMMADYEEALARSDAAMPAADPVWLANPPASQTSAEDERSTTTAASKPTLRWWPA